MNTITPEEIFDVVDEEDRIVDARPRNEVHRLGLRHRSTHLLVFDTKDRVFLQKRSMSKDENPGQWDSSVSGHVDSGESYDDCVVREAVEEIGLVLEKPPQRLFKFDAVPETGMEFCWVYRTASDGPFELDPVEIDEGRWFTSDDINAAIETGTPELTPSLIAIWHRLFAQME